jgi:hypothetical protein
LHDYSRSEAVKDRRVWFSDGYLGPHASAFDGSIAACEASRRNKTSTNRGNIRMKKSIPDSMFNDRDQIRLSALQSWVLEHGVTEIVMTERQFWRFVTVQPLAEKPWTSFMGRSINVPDMPERSQKHLGLFDGQGPGHI